jgi:glutamyl-Q tRNA(Asp) synthetase
LPGFVTRFAPSPTGLLHLGHAFSALTAWDLARQRGGSFLLRIEDTDRARCRPAYEAAIREDLAWLGIRWPEPVLRQSEHLGRYAAALERLTAMGLTYPCRCTRADIRAALSAPQERAGHNGPVYPGTCRGRRMESTGTGEAIRLDLGRAIRHLGGVSALGIEEDGRAHAGAHALDAGALRARTGDVVLARKDIGAAAYHLAVVVDDAHQGVTHVVRGEDLWEATALHRLLQALLGLPVPVWHHHRLIRDEQGRRLAKRDDALALATLRAAGATPADIRRRVGLGARPIRGRLPDPA